MSKNHAYKNVEAQIRLKFKNIVVILLVALQGRRAAQTSGLSTPYFKSDAIYSPIQLTSNAGFISCV